MITDPARPLRGMGFFGFHSLSSVQDILGLSHFTLDIYIPAISS